MVGLGSYHGYKHSQAKFINLTTSTEENKHAVRGQFVCVYFSFSLNKISIKYPTWNEKKRGNGNMCGKDKCTNRYTVNLKSWVKEFNL